MDRQVDSIIFPVRPASILTIRNAPKFLARLVTSDVSRLPSGKVCRTAMLNASGGMLDIVHVFRLDTQTVAIVLDGEKAAQSEAWVRQVAIAFDCDVESLAGAGFAWSGKLPVSEIDLGKWCGKEAKGLLFLQLGWRSVAVGGREVIARLHQSLAQAGIEQGSEEQFEALRILAAEPAFELEYDETVSPLEIGLNDALDFADQDRIFIGRALTEARSKTHGIDKMRLVAFSESFDPRTLTEVPGVIVGEYAYLLSSLVRVPQMEMTVGLVRLPESVGTGDVLDVMVKTEPEVACTKARVIEPQIV